MGSWLDLECGFKITFWVSGRKEHNRGIREYFYTWPELLTAKKFTSLAVWKCQNSCLAIRCYNLILDWDEIPVLTVGQPWAIEMGSWLDLECDLKIMFWVYRRKEWNISTLDSNKTIHVVDCVTIPTLVPRNYLLKFNFVTGTKYVFLLPNKTIFNCPTALFVDDYINLQPYIIYHILTKFGLSTRSYVVNKLGNKNNVNHIRQKCRISTQFGIRHTVDLNEI